MPTSLPTPITLPVKYGTAVLGPLQNLEKIVFQTTGGVAVFQVAKLDQTGKPQFDQNEATLPPGIWGFDKIYGIQLRSRDAGSLATLDPCTGYFQEDPDPYNPGNIPGSSTSVTGAVNIQHNDALVASQPTIDFEDSTSGTFAWTITNDGANTRVKVTPPDHVGSVFGRQGVVTAQTGDYTAAQVTNAADKSSVSTQIFSGSLSTGPGSTAFTGSQTTGVFISTGGQMTSFGAAAYTLLNSGLTTDTVNRFNLNYAGQMLWGAGGASAVDVRLIRTAAGRMELDGTASGGAVRFDIVPAATSNVAFSTFIVGDTQPRLDIRISTTGATLEWGPGNAATDTTLDRTITNPTPAHLTSNASLALGGGVYTSATVVTGAIGFTMTPDCNAADTWTANITTGAGTLTIANPINPPATNTQGYRLTIAIRNNQATNSETLSWGTAYFFRNFAKPTTIAASTTDILVFVWEPDNGAWFCVGIF